MERNDDRTPFEHVIDLRFRQELFGAFFEDVSSRAQKLELTVDIFNFTNFLNKDWGRRYAGVGALSVTQFQGFDGDALANDEYLPEYVFTAPFAQFLNDNPAFSASSLTPEQLDRAIEGYNSKDDVFRNEVIDSGSNYGSRWQIQIGFRYTF